MATQAASKVELGASTLEEIVDALSVGRAIAAPKSADDFILNSEDARTIFCFYASRRDLWPSAKPLSAKEIDDLLQWLENPKTITSKARPALIANERPRWRLIKVEAHRFAGLHRHCDDKGQAPERFLVELDRDITCIWGFNGAGKTALQSAIMWCLTGHAHRSQHKPAEVHEPISAAFIAEEVVENSSAESNQRILTLPPIVPLPSAENLAVLSDKPNVDTWVELTLKDRLGEEIVVKREIRQRLPKGSVSVHTYGRELLRLPEWAIEAGTLMPAVAATMRFDEKTTFADAIAQLTGLKPLEDLGKRSVRIVGRLTGDEKSKAEEDKGQASTQFGNSKKTLVEAWETQIEVLGQHPELHSPAETGLEANCKNAIQLAKAHLARCSDRGQADIVAILGAVPPLQTKEQIATFVEDLNSAQEHLSAAVLATLPSIGTLKSLAKILPEERREVRAKLQEFRSRAIGHVERLENKKAAARWQLYTMVGRWHQSHHPGSQLTDCPICGTNLTEVPRDALLDKDVAEALALSAKADVDVAKTLHEWQKDAASELLESVPDSLKIFADKKPPATLLDLFREAYVSELLNHTVFGKQLNPIKQMAPSIWNLAVEANPLPLEEAFDLVDLPMEYKTSTLASRFANLQAALALSAYRELSESQLKSVGQRYFGSGSFDRTVLGQAIIEAPLRHQILALQQAIEASHPILALQRQLDELETIRLRWEKANKRLQFLSRAALAVQQFTGFPALVHHQVAGLIEVLDERTRIWLGLIYRPHYVGGPTYVGLDPTRQQGLGLQAGIGSLRVQAHQVMNSSHLRACVWSFVFSLWERIRDQSGALDLLLLDDPQTYFDPINTENLAAAIPALVDAGMRPIITSNDHRFIAAVKHKLPKNSTNSPTWAMLQINPISRSRLTAALTPSVDEVIERRDSWRREVADADKARNFVERVRLYVENRLWDLLAADPILMYKPTLAVLIQHIDTARNAGEKPFNEEPFARLVCCEKLRSSSRFYSIINHAHHDLRNITPQDAQDADDGFDEVDRLLRSCSASYARFMGRLTREDEDMFFAVPPAMPPAVSIQIAPLRIVGNFSARTNADSIAIEGEAKTFLFDRLGDVALYAVRGAGLGALALPGQIVIASLTLAPKDGDPVIALHGEKVLARRYYSDFQDASRLTLICDQSGSENVAPAQTLQRAKVRLFPIIGILYDNLSKAGSHEAYLVGGSSILERSLLVASISEDSGYPVVRNGDAVLLERISLPDGVTLDRMKSDMVALVASRHGESFAYLKRVGPSIAGNLRLFENVGTFGDSLALLCPGRQLIDSAQDIMTLQSIWVVRGVIRHDL